MANTTFSGKVRAQGGFAVLYVDPDTGAETETPLTVTGSALTAGSGITTGTGTVYTATTSRVGNVITTDIYINLTGLNSAATDDIIGKQATANCHLGRITTAVNGTLFAGTMTCIVAPVTGDTDIDLYSATESTGTEDAAIGGLTETALLAAGGAWTAGETQTLTALPAANQYLYLTAGGAGADATYTAGQFLLSFKGYAA